MKTKESSAEISNVKKELKDETKSERVLTGHYCLVFRWIAIFASLFSIYLATLSFMQPLAQRGSFLCVMLILCFGYLRFSNKSSANKIDIIDYVFMALGVVTTLYVAINNEDLLYRFGIPTQLDLILGVIFIIVVLESTRRSVGWPLVVIALTAFLYGLFGHLIPGQFGHPVYNFAKIIGMLYVTTNGIWGFVLAFVVSTLAMFLLMGAFLNVSGAGKYFIRFAEVVGGGSTGGPAKVAVIGSSIFGSVSGSAVANVTATGTFTIPTMKKAGYPSSFAGAVEACASSGGQIMPPVMGAGAFVMAEMLGISYVTVMKAALVPAIFFFAALFLGVHFGAHRYNIEKTPKQSLKGIEFLSLVIYFLLPLIVLMIFLFNGYSPAMAAMRALLISVCLCFFDIETKSLQPKEGLLKVLKGLEIGGRQIMSMTIMMASIGIVVGIINMTGIGLTVANAILKIGGSNLLLALILTMGVSVVLGMGLPTVAAYVVAGIIGGPALIKLGIPPITAHLFVFYFAVLSAITPPVCIAVMAGASIAQANWVKVATEAVKLALPVFIVPFIFAYQPGILLDAPILQLVPMLITGSLGIVGIATGTMGFLIRKCANWERVLLIIAGFLMMVPELISDISGIIIIGLIYLNQKRCLVRKSTEATI